MISYSSFIILMITLGVVLEISFINITNSRFNLREKIILGAALISEIIILRSTIDFLLVPCLFITLFLINKIKNKYRNWKNCFHIFLVLLGYFIVDAIVRIVCVIMFQDIDLKNSYAQIIYIVLSSIFYIILSRFIGQIIKSNLDGDKRRNYKEYIILGNVLLSFIVIAISCIIYKMLNITDTRVYIVNLILFFVCILSSVFLLYLFNMYSSKETEILLKDAEMKNIEEYSRFIEDLYENIRKFKHDYKNILLSLDYYIKEKQYNELEQYYMENILATESFVAQDDYTIKLKNIKIISLKALLASKLMKASIHNINVFVDIPEEIATIPIDNQIDILRVFGNLLDNAIEGSLETMEKRISFGAIYKGNSLVFIIQNSCKSDIPPVFQLLKKGTSTKGNDRGLGLSTVKEILNKYENCTLNLDIHENVFTVELWLRL
jgi:two-component system sensor histidine kinase AgrC